MRYSPFRGAVEAYDPRTYQVRRYDIRPPRYGRSSCQQLLALRDGKYATDSSVTVDTDHAGLWLGSVFTTYIDGLDISAWGQSGKLSSLFPVDYERGVFQGIADRTTAIYQTKDPKVWYQLHGSLDTKKTLESMGIDATLKFDEPREYYDFLQKHIIQWSPNELEMHNVPHGLCGSICYSLEGWRKTEMGKRLDSDSLIKFSKQAYAKLTPRCSFLNIYLIVGHLLVSRSWRWFELLRTSNYEREVEFD